MRKYDDPVEVRRGWVAGVEAPEQFLWRGRLWKVRAVLAHWVETGPWWESSGARDVIGSAEPPAATRVEQQGPVSLGELVSERELWRVEAGRGPGPVRPAAALPPVAETAGPDTGGVFDLSFDWSDGCWQLVGCAD
ncbi:DUF6504 family protein [Nocardioides sp. SYSU D00038]|uniref:DUF6504 family protein n=1 Tax=Nocardioides sp. SYSU D00038 TaxID=2812554 RepID=UPI0019676A03|nr:DUF6504 family protein [Nocardioides sp. SYSU D00038]